MSLIVEVFQAINSSVLSSSYQQAAEEIVDFEIKIAEVRNVLSSIISNLLT